MTEIPKVCIIVLNWQALNHTIECIQSLEALEYENSEIIIVDNGSQDGSEEALRKKFPQHTLIQTGRNLGYAGGNNKGIAYAIKQNPDFIFILNNDTVVDASLLTIFVESAKSNPEAGVFSPKIYDYRKREKLLYAGTRWIEERSKFLIEGQGELDQPSNNSLHEIDYAAGSALFFRSELASRVGFFDDRFFLTWEETDWCCRVRKMGYKILLEPKAKVWHKTSASFAEGQSGPEYRYYLTRNRLLWIEKNLKGRSKWRAYKKTFEAVFAEQDKRLARAKRTGLLHYLVRRFYEGPVWK